MICRHDLHGMAPASCAVIVLKSDSLPDGPAGRDPSSMQENHLRALSTPGRPVGFSDSEAHGHRKLEGRVILHVATAFVGLPRTSLLTARDIRLECGP